MHKRALGRDCWAIQLYRPRHKAPYFFGHRATPGARRKPNNYTDLARAKTEAPINSNL